MQFEKIPLTPEEKLAQAERVSQSISTSLRILEAPNKQVYEKIAENLSPKDIEKMKAILEAYEEKTKEKSP